MNNIHELPHFSTESGKMKTCYLCTRELSTPYNLRRHMKLCHNKNFPLNVGKIKAVEHRNNWNIQTGRGLPMDSEDTSKDSDLSDSESEKIKLSSYSLIMIEGSRAEVIRSPE